MFDRAREHVRKTTRFLREDVATVVSVDASGGYVLTYRGVNVGPVWSVNGVLYAAGDVVKVMVDGSRVKEVIP